MKVSQLKPDTRNANKGTVRGRKVVADSLRKYGAGRSILLDRGGNIIAGNKTAELGLEWDTEILKQFEAEEIDLAPFFNERELVQFWVGLGGKEAPEAKIDQAAALQAKWGTELGQLWLIGAHRILCGDSTTEASAARLWANSSEVPALMVTDPPYGVNYRPEWRAEAGVNHNEGKLGQVRNDDRADWTPAWELFKGDVAYVWHAGRFASTVQASLEAAGFEVRNQIIWAKDRFALSRGDYHWQHEPCWYVVRKGAKSEWGGARDQSTLWEIPAREDSGRGHGTPKPIECMARAIRNHEHRLVYDPFLGSGTTMAAAQTLGRVCYAMEVDPAYVAVALERMSEMDLVPKLHA